MKHSEEVKKKRVALLLGLKSKADGKNISEEKMAGEAGIRSNNAARLLQGKYSPPLDTVIAMAAAAGYDLALIEKR